MKIASKKKPKPYVLTVKLDPAFGRQLRAYAHRHDTTMSQVVKHSVRRSINDGAMTLEPVEQMSPWLESRIAEAEAERTAGKSSGALRARSDIEHFLRS